MRKEKVENKCEVRVKRYKKKQPFYKMTKNQLQQDKRDKRFKLFVEAYSH